MTREEAKRIATGLRTDFKCESDTMVDFCNTVIKALEQEPCEDAISRQAAIDAANKVIERDTSGNNDVVNAMIAWSAYIKSLPSVKPQEPKTGHWIRVDDSKLKFDDEERTILQQWRDEGKITFSISDSCTCTNMANYKDRHEQRKVTETMNTLLLPLLPFLNSETANVVKRALYLLGKIDIEPQESEDKE